MTTRPPTTWEDGARQALDDIDTLQPPPLSIEMARRAIVGQYHSETVPGPFAVAFEQTSNLLRRIGSWARDHQGLRFSGNETFVEFLAGKQHDYGQDNITTFGVSGLLVRLHDKLARLANLAIRSGSASPGTVAHESVADTWDDIVGYCVVGLMVLAGTFTLPLERDVAGDAA